jgi:2-succinyl-5-enolpyruvyl-6-hydroxy-3-cyclohexene-1-carboxylate synthase
MAALAASRREVGDDRAALRLHVRIDERSAGFLALGLAKASGQPVVVLTTSGTAVANLHPAVLEADHAGVPLIVLTADRPPEQRGVGANQTTDQTKIFGGAVRLFHEVGVPRREVGQVAYWRALAFRAVVAARGARSRDPGPVHLNVAFDGSLLPDDSDDWPEPLTSNQPGPRPSDEPGVRSDEIEPGPRTIVLAGDAAGPVARWLAEDAGWPLLAEPSSGARAGSNAIGPYRLLLDRPELGGSIERVVAVGQASLSRPVAALLSRSDVELVVIAPRAPWPDAGHNARLVASHAHLRATLPGSEATPPDAWLRSWTVAGAAATSAIDAVLAATPGPTGPSVARRVAAGLTPGELLWAGSSSPIRDLDLAMRPYEHPLVWPFEWDRDPTTYVHVLANRGLSGIDGAVSSAIGAALHHQRAGLGRAVALLGDLTFLHDANGLVLGPDDPRPDLTIVVVNDDGGGLFHLLEQGASDHSASFERVFGTPHGVDLGSLCAATGTPFAQATTIDELTTLLGQASTGIRVIEVPIERADRRDLHERIQAAVEAALDGLAGSLS